jgi:hypothetical protein
VVANVVTISSLCTRTKSLVRPAGTRVMKLFKTLFLPLLPGLVKTCKRDNKEVNATNFGSSSLLYVVISLLPPLLVGSGAKHNPWSEKMCLSRKDSMKQRSL